MLSHTYEWCIGNRMNASEFRDLWARVMFGKFSKHNARALKDCNLRTFKTSRLSINHELYQQVHTIFHLLYSQQNFVLKHCTRYSLHKILQLFPTCSHVLYEPIRKIMTWQANLFKFLSPQICIKLFNLNLKQWLYDFTRGNSWSLIVTREYF